MWGQVIFFLKYIHVLTILETARWGIRKEMILLIIKVGLQKSRARHHEALENQQVVQSQNN